MDLSPESIYQSIASLLSRSTTHTVWVERNDAGFTNPTYIPQIHAIDKAKRHLIVKLVQKKQDWNVVVEHIPFPSARSEVVFEEALNDPESLTKLEEFFGVKSMDDPVKPVDRMAVITAMLG